LGGVVPADLWDVERVSHCRACASARRARLARINLSGQPEPRVVCGECGGRCPMALRVAVIGSGFAGTILARILRRQGHEPVLIDRGTHPRFALGESSTPLAAICLERLAERYGLEDLRDMAAYGRWMAHMPEVRRGLKRGFTFYRHEPDQPFRNDAHNCHRLLVAASPHDGVADSHWLREDIDRFLVQRAVVEDVEVLDQ